MLAPRLDSDELLSELLGPLFLSSGILVRRQSGCGLESIVKAGELGLLPSLERIRQLGESLFLLVGDRGIVHLASSCYVVCSGYAGLREVAP